MEYGGGMRDTSFANVTEVFPLVGPRPTAIQRFGVWRWRLFVLGQCCQDECIASRVLSAGKPVGVRQLLHQRGSTQVEIPAIQVLAYDSI